MGMTADSCRHPQLIPDPKHQYHIPRFRSGPLLSICSQKSEATRPLGHVAQAPIK